MKTTRILLVAMLAVLVTTNLSFGQQWSGASNTTGNISRSGHVGIGVDPLRKLHVRAEDGFIGLFESKTNSGLVTLATSEGNPNVVEIINRSGGHLALSTGRIDQFVIYRNGNVSIRPGVVPTRKLDIGGHLVLNTDSSSPFEAGGELVLANGDPLSTPTWHIDHIPGGAFRIFHQTSINSSVLGTLALLATPAGNIGIGKGPDPQAKLDVAGTTKTQVLEITGGSDLAEPFEIEATESIKPGIVVAIDPDKPGQLRVADKAYDHTVAGIISGANGVNPGLTMKHEGTAADGSFPVSLTGRVYCWADASYGAIKPGDLLTTSDTFGHAMKVTDHTKAQGAVIGKAMSPLKNGKGLVLVLVSLQ